MRLNLFKLNKHTRPRTHEGAPARVLNAEQALRRTVLSCMLWEGEFYEDGVQIASRMQELVPRVNAENVAALAVEASWIARSKPAVVHGVRTRVLAPEELLASKIFVTRRERFDGADIAHVIYGTRGNVDWQRVLFLAGDHWEMLLWALLFFRYCYPAHTYYVPRTIWQTLLERFRGVALRPDPGARFRGSLVDPKMFAIDVNEWGLDNLLAEYRNRRLESIPASPGSRSEKLAS